MVPTVIAFSAFCYRQVLMTPGGSIDHLTANQITESWELVTAQVCAIDQYFPFVYSARIRYQAVGFAFKMDRKI